MIDHLDKQTQSLPLEPKRGRGRPATGQALSNAERQRRYREAQKTQRNENMHKEVAEDLRTELAKAMKRAEIAEARADLMGNELAIVKAKLSNPKNAKEELSWMTQYRLKGDRKWNTSKSYGVRAGTDDAKEFIDEMNKKDKQTSWRCVSTTGLIYDPKALK